MSLRHAMLGLLAHGRASGYDLLKTFDASLANVWPATQSQLYTELGRLTDAGLVAVYAEGPRGRKEYVLTEAGGEELRHWLTEVEPDPPRRNDALLRVFFLDQLEPHEAHAYLERRAAAAAEAHARLVELREVVAKEVHPLGSYGMLTLEYGLRFNEMVGQWAQWAADRVAAGEPRPGAPASD